jgi:hypothetical protein
MCFFRVTHVLSSVMDKTGLQICRMNPLALCPVRGMGFNRPELTIVTSEKRIVIGSHYDVGYSMEKEIHG